MVENHLVFPSLLFLMSCHVPLLRILMGKRAPLSLRFSFVCTEGLHRHSFEIMAYCDILGPAPSTGKMHLSYFTGSLKMVASLGCIYRGLTTSRRSIERGMGNQTACSRTGTWSVFRSHFSIAREQCICMLPVFNLRSGIKD